MNEQIKNKGTYKQTKKKQTIKLTKKNKKKFKEQIKNEQ